MITPMSRVSPPRTWDTDDRALQALFGLALWDREETFQPKWGAGITLPLRNMSIELVRKLALDPSGTTILGEPQEPLIDAPAAPVKLAWHFGHMDWIVENTKELIRKSKGTIQGSDIHYRFFTSAERVATEEFLCRRVRPLSRAALALEHPLYVQSLPLHLIEFEMATSHFLSLSSGERVIGVLPVTVESAEFYHVTDIEMRMFAPQVMWAVYYRCAHNSIETPDQLVRALDGWSPFVDPKLRIHLYEKLEKYRPYLLTEHSTQALLPEG